MKADAYLQNGNYNDLISGLEASVSGMVSTVMYEGLNAVYITNDQKKLAIEAWEKINQNQTTLETPNLSNTTKTKIEVSNEKKGRSLISAQCCMKGLIKNMGILKS